MGTMAAAARARGGCPPAGGGPACGSEPQWAGGDHTTRRPGGYDAARAQALAGYLFIAPAMVIFFVFTLLPVAIALYLSFTNYDVFTRMDWIGVANYQDVFEDEFFWRAFWNTTTYTAWTIPQSMAIGLGLAL